MGSTVIRFYTVTNSHLCNQGRRASILQRMYSADKGVTVQKHICGVKHKPHSNIRCRILADQAHG